MKTCALALFCLLICSCAARGDAGGIQVTHHTDLSSLLNWCIAACLFGLAASIAATIWLPIPKWIGLFGITLFGLTIGGALTVETILPILPWIVLGLFVVAGAIGAFYLWTHKLKLATAEENVSLAVQRFKSGGGV